MSSGAAGLTLTSFFLTSDQETLVQSMVFFWFVLGLGVGGEYPLAASQASENAAGFRQHPSRTTRDGLLAGEHEHSTSANNVTSDAQVTITESHRGRQVRLVFSMQGMGILLNSITMTVLLLITNYKIGELRQANAQNQYQDDGQQYDVQGSTAFAMLAIWRTTYTFATLVLMFFLVQPIYVSGGIQSMVGSQENETRNNRSTGFPEISQFAIHKRQQQPTTKQQHLAGCGPWPSIRLHQDSLSPLSICPYYRRCLQCLHPRI
jgi:MFS family permease